MRGAPLHGPSKRLGRGIIPAYAGSTTSRWKPTPSARDHPRVCGEHLPPVACTLAKSGSSPRMRGAPHEPSTCTADAGIIPAYAGSTVFHQPGRQKSGDHPRVCGEHSFSSARAAKIGGSSPRMRGALRLQTPVTLIIGIIPAYAGSTGGRHFGFWRRRDHPRVCGEHIMTALITRSQTGSSPRMRGALLRDGGRDDRAGIIPAYAGSTGEVVPSSRPMRDHPRVCGEHSMI